MRISTSFLLFALCVVCSFSGFSQQIQSIIISGNDQTKEELILDYLDLYVGEEIQIGELAKELGAARLRLINSSLFLTVDLAYEIAADDLVVFVHVTERWYYWLYPILEHADRNFASFVKSGDWSRINYGLSFEKHNFRGRDEFLKFKMRLGFRSQIGVMYDIPTLRKNRDFGLQFSVDRFNQKKLLTGIEENKPVYYFDEGSGLDEWRFRTIWHIRFNHYQKLHFLLEYQDYHFSKMLDSVAPDYLFQTDPDLAIYSSKLKYDADYRDDKYYPIDGFYGSVSVEHKGAIGNNGPSLIRVIAELAWYQPIAEKWSFSSEGWVNSQIGNYITQPFLYSGVIGFDHFPRGYEYNIVLSNAGFGLNETLRYRLYKSRVLDLDFIPIEAFQPFDYSLYLYGFADFAYALPYDVYPGNDFLNDKLLFGYGIGLDFVTYYDRSLGFHLAMTNQKAFGIFATFRSPLYKSI